jgi:hypothetical protein
MNQKEKKERAPRNMWTPIEDARLRELVAKYGVYEWAKISESMPGRGPRRCRERWFSCLSPNLKNQAWTSAEEALLIETYERIGPKWSEMTFFFPGRSDMGLKNRYASLMRKKAGKRSRGVGLSHRVVTDTIPAEGREDVPRNPFDLDNLLFNLRDINTVNAPNPPNLDDLFSNDTVGEQNTPDLNELLSNLRRIDTDLEKKYPNHDGYIPNFF